MTDRTSCKSGSHESPSLRSLLSDKNEKGPVCTIKGHWEDECNKQNEPNLIYWEYSWAGRNYGRGQRSCIVECDLVQVQPAAVVMAYIASLPPSLPRQSTGLRKLKGRVPTPSILNALTDSGGSLTRRPWGPPAGPSRRSPATHGPQLTVSLFPDPLP